jgi:hypothetical protein
LTDIERSPNTVKAYAHDLKDYFTFLGLQGVDWREVRLEDLGEFVAWLRRPPGMREGNIALLPSVEHHCTEATVNRKPPTPRTRLVRHHQDRRTGTAACLRCPRSNGPTLLLATLCNLRRPHSDQPQTGATKPERWQAAAFPWVAEAVAPARTRIPGGAGHR